MSLKFAVSITALMLTLTACKSEADKAAGQQAGPSGSSIDIVRSDLPSRLGDIRLAISRYYGDTEGKRPSSMDELIPKYLPAVPVLWKQDASLPFTYPHPQTTDVVYYSHYELRDSGSWAFINNPADPHFGGVYIDCSHLNPKWRLNAFDPN